MTVEIRSYQDADEKAVTALWKQVFSDMPAWNIPEADIDRKLQVQPELFLVAILEEQVVGTAMAGFDGHRGWVYYLAVSPERRRQGIGRELMRWVEEGLAAMGCPKLNLQVRGSNAQAASFYKRLGYVVEDRVSMSKRLKGGEGG